ncbi:hypothetical protein ATY76_19500 [Rhizobium sp. R339]|nr:hypothetical protein ATY76_19500 [Rhizobium sp. R339]
MHHQSNFPAALMLEAGERYVLIKRGGQFRFKFGKPWCDWLEPSPNFGRLNGFRATELRPKIGWRHLAADELFAFRAFASLTRGSRPVLCADERRGIMGEPTRSVVPFQLKP